MPRAEEAVSILVARRSGSPDASRLDVVEAFREPPTSAVPVREPAKRAVARGLSALGAVKRRVRVAPGN
jgi:hypothetical protein